MSGSNVEELKGSGSRHEALAWPWLVASPPASAPKRRTSTTVPSLSRSAVAEETRFLLRRHVCLFHASPYLSDHLRPQAPLLVHI